MYMYFIWAVAGGGGVFFTIFFNSNSNVLECYQ